MSPCLDCSLLEVTNASTEKLPITDYLQKETALTYPILSVYRYNELHGFGMVTSLFFHVIYLSANSISSEFLYTL